ncbi:MAG TPA: hemerythrin domain-containing protein [Chitinophagaceae bacterium]|nr:hemerythrin domain-containing protein [Chitinophagaceae bacterium]
MKKPAIETKANRRGFIEKGLQAGAVAGILGVSFLTGCKENKEGEDKEVSPPEDLMQEHGLLNRVLLIYDNCRTQLLDKKNLPADQLYHAAGIIRTFVEDYHEKQEENYLFPRFEKAGQLTELVKVLRQQHQAGRNITEQLMSLSKSTIKTENENQKIIQLITRFNTMYRPHEAREDTVLFPAFRKIVSKHEYDSLGEEFEKNEHTLFGKDGFETMVGKVTAIEKSLGIYELSQFTPVLI